MRPFLGAQHACKVIRRRFAYSLCEFMTQKSYPYIWMRSAHSMCCFEHVQNASVCAY
jgi:hypothetical protein